MATPGLVNTTVNKQDPLSGIKGYNPEKVELNTGTDTVEGRVSNIVDSGSPLMRQAETRALQNMNRRGVVNSSMAIGAGQGALYDAALPIASQDASQMVQNKQFNVNTGNRASEFTASQINPAAMQERQGQQNIETVQAQGDQQRETIGTQTEAESRLTGERAGYEKELQVTLQNLRGEQAERLTALENQNRTLLQSSLSAASIMSQASASIALIQSNPDIPGSQKQRLIDSQIQLLENSLSVQGKMADLDLTGLLDF